MQVGECGCEFLLSMFIELLQFISFVNNSDCCVRHIMRVNVNQDFNNFDNLLHVT